MVCNGAEKLGAAGDGTVFADLKLFADAGEVVKNIVLGKIPGILERIVVISTDTNFDLGIVDDVLQIDHGTVIVHHINTGIVVFPHEITSF